MAPSVSYSITVRLEVASRGRAVSEITRAVEHTGGVVTALDVTSGGSERLRVDVTCAARDTAHAEAIVAALAAIDAWPICLDSQDTDEIVRTVQLIAPGFGGINLEDISAPRCFEVERRLRELLDVPVFHDDQHGTAIVVMAALTNALRVVGKKLPEVRIAMAGAGAAGTAVLKLLLGAGAAHITVADDQGAVYASRPGLNPSLRWIAEHTNRDGYAGDYRPQRLPESDQQRAGLPRRVPRAARRAEPAHQRRHADRRRAGAGRRGLARRDRPALHHPVGLPSGRDLIGRGRGQRRRSIGYRPCRNWHRRT